MQGKLADVWKENIIKNLKRRLLNYKAVEEFLTDKWMCKYGKESWISQRMQKIKELEEPVPLHN